MDFRFVAHDPQTGTKLYQLPRANSVNIGDTFGTRGTLELTYSAKAVNARDLPTFLEVQPEVTFDSGHNWAEVGPSLLRLSGEHEDTDQAGMRTLRFVGREWVLGKARVGNGDLELIDGKRPFYRASPGQILRTLILEAQDRGAADGIEIGNFTAAKDSSGKAWAKVATIYYSPGLPIGSVLENLVEQGMCDYRMNGRTIELFDPETTMGRDLTTGNNPVRVHGAVTEAPVKYTLEDLANSALLMGDEGFELEVDNPTAPDDYGRLEVTIEQGGVSDSGTARLMVDEALHRGSREVREITRSQSAAGAAFLPLRDYRVGDYVQVRTGGAWERYRVREIQLARDGDEWTIHTIINDRLQELLLKLAKRTSGIVNGSKGSGGDGTRPTPPAKPGIEPAAPEGLVIDQQVYLDRQGIARGQITAGWGSVTESTKGTAVEIGGYELWTRRNETHASWVRAASTDGDLTATHSPVVLSDAGGNALEYQWRVRAIAQASNRPGPWSDTVTLTMTQDTEPPNVPSMPTVETDLRIVTVDWDGLDESAEAMPVDFNHLRIYFAAAEGMAGAERVGSLTQRGTWTSGSMPADVPVWVAVSAVDNVGNESAMTPAQSVTPKKLVDDDSIRDAVDGIDGKIDDAVRDLNDAIENIVVDANGTTTYWMPTAPDETTDPKPKTGDLWFDTSTAGKNKLHRFDGARWVSAADERIDTIGQAQDQFGQDITDAEARAIQEAQSLADQARLDAESNAATDAQSKADAARDQAVIEAEAKDQSVRDDIDGVITGAVDDLSSQIDSVRTSANGKNSITQSTSTPPNQYAGTVGDRWERMSSMGSGGRLVSNWRWNGTVWVSTLIGDAVLGNVDASKIGTGYLEADRIESGTITADKILVGAGRSILPWSQILSGATASPHVNRNYSSTGTLEVGEPDSSAGVPRHLKHTRTEPGANTDAVIIELRSNVPVSGDPASGKFAVSGGSWTLGGRAYTSVANLSATFLVVWYKADFSYGGEIRGNTVKLSSSPRKVFVEMAVPDSAAYAIPYIRTSQPGETHWVGMEFSQAVSATLIEDGAITTDKVAAGAIEAGKIAAGAIEADHVQAGAIDTGALAAGAVTAETLAADAIKAKHVSAGAIGATAIASHVITGDHIEAGSLLADSVLVQGSVSATLIEDGAITTDKIEAGAITAESGIIGSINAGTILVGEMDGDRIKAGTITAKHLLVGRTEDLAPSVANYADEWSLSNGAFIFPWDAASDGRGIQLRYQEGSSAYGPYRDTMPGESWYAEAYASQYNSTSATVNLRIYFYDADKAYISSVLAASGAGQIGGSAIAPEGAAFARYRLVHTGTLGDGWLSIRDMHGGAQAGATLIEDGAITTDKILANAITAGKIAALAIEADHISANAITADKIRAGAIDSMLITGARIRTAASGRRTELDVEGLKSYDSSGRVVLTTQTSDGSISMKGILSQTISGVTLRVGVGWEGDYPGVQWSDSNIYNYPPGVGLKAVDGESSKKETVIQGPGVSTGNSYLSLKERGERFRLRTWKGDASSPDDWIVEGNLTDNLMRIGSSTNDAPYMYFKRGAGDTGAAWIGYRHPTNGGYSSMALRDRYAWLGSYDSKGSLVGRLTMDASGSRLNAGTRDLYLYGSDVVLNPTNDLYMPGLPPGSSAVPIGRDGHVCYISSSRKSKLIEEPIESTVESFEDRLLSVDAKTWVDRRRAEMIADQQTAIANGEDHKELPEGMGGLERIPGVVAEDMIDAGLELFVHFDESGDPMSVMYDRIGPALIPIIRRLRDRVDALETKLGENNAA